MLVFKKAILFLLVSCLIFMCSGCSIDCDFHYDTVISTHKILTATDVTTVNGIISGGGCIVWHISGSISETSVYRFYYQLEDGGMKLEEIPSESTTIYYIKNDEQPYIEVYEHGRCTQSVPHVHETFIDYNLYVPEGSILNVFEFDGS